MEKTKNFNNKIGEISVHHIHENLFCGYNEVTDKKIKLASPEKALFDFIYFSAARSKIFSKMPEVNFENGFNHKKFMEYVELIKNQKKKKIIFNRYQKIFTSLEN